MPVVGMITGAAHVDCCRTQVQLDLGWNFSKALSLTRLISIQKISLRHTDLTRGKVGMWHQVRPAQRCVISVQRCFSCCVTTGSFSFISRVGCCSLQTSCCPRLPGLAPAVGAVCCISWNKCRLWESQRVLTCHAELFLSRCAAAAAAVLGVEILSLFLPGLCAASVQTQLPGIVSTPACSGLL